MRALAVVLVLALALPSCGGEPTPGTSGTIELRSSAFAPMTAIPKKYAGQGEGDDVSPPLSWSKVPEGTKELVVFVDDPDAKPTWTHWVVYAIPPTATGLPEGVPATSDALKDPPGAVQGRNSWGRVGYSGPLPPAGEAHKYQFWVYAVDARLSLPAGATRDDVFQALGGHVLGNGRFVAKYPR
jgi:Raf kinase inhibitor-like YbhB/YbcL family protein